MMSTDIKNLYNIFRKYPCICTDSRKALKNSIFFALGGENFDGNDFAEDALAKGCVFAVIDKLEIKKDDRYILVKDVLKTLQELAQHHRRQFNIPVIGITGSNGKTTTKELIKAVLDKKYNVVATAENKNNHIGVPLTLLSITPETGMAVVEIGTNSPGEIRLLSSMTEPDFGLITNIGKAHLEGLGSEEEVAREKSNLFSEVRKKGGKVFVNMRDKKIVDLSSGLEQISYDPAELKVKEDFPYLVVSYGDVVLRTNLFGRYNIPNIAAALKVGYYFDVSPEQIKSAIEKFNPQENRSQVIPRKNGGFVLLDAYNANPTSMNQVLDCFLKAKTSNPKSIILGDMLEVGENSLEEHIEILSRLNENSLALIILVGPIFSRAKNEAKLGDEKIICFENIGGLCEHLSQNKKGLAGHVFVKGSRKTALEKALPFLI